MNSVAHLSSKTVSELEKIVAQQKHIHRTMSDKLADRGQKIQVYIDYVERLISKRRSNQVGSRGGDSSRLVGEIIERHDDDRPTKGQIQTSTGQLSEQIDSSSRKSNKLTEIHEKQQHKEENELDDVINKFDKLVTLKVDHVREDNRTKTRFIPASTLKHEKKDVVSKDDVTEKVAAGEDMISGCGVANSKQHKRLLESFDHMIDTSSRRQAHMLSLTDSYHLLITQEQKRKAALLSDASLSLHSQQQQQQQRLRCPLRDEASLSNTSEYRDTPYCDIQEEGEGEDSLDLDEID